MLALAGPAVAGQGSTLALGRCDKTSGLPTRAPVHHMKTVPATGQRGNVALMISGALSQLMQQQHYEIMDQMARNLIAPLSASFGTIDVFACTDVELSPQARALLLSAANNFYSAAWCLGGVGFARPLNNKLPPQFLRMASCFRMIPNPRRYTFIVRTRPDTSVLAPFRPPPEGWPTAGITARVRSVVGMAGLQNSQLTANMDGLFCHYAGTGTGATETSPSCLTLDDQLFIVPGALSHLVFDFNRTANKTTTFDSRVALLTGSTPNDQKPRCPNEDIAETWFNAHLIAAGVARHILPAGTAQTCLAYTKDDFSLNFQLMPTLSEASRHALESTLRGSSCTIQRRAGARAVNVNESARAALLSDRLPSCPEPCFDSPDLLKRTLGHTCRWSCDWFALPANAMKPAMCKPHPYSVRCSTSGAGRRVSDHGQPCTDDHNEPHHRRGFLSRAVVTLQRTIAKVKSRVDDFIQL